MIRRFVQGMSVLGLLCLAGCLHPVEERIDGTVCDMAAKPWDLQPIDHAIRASTTTTESTEVKQAEYQVTPGKGAPKTEGPAKKNDIKDLDSVPKTLSVPDELSPGGKVNEIKLPPLPDEKNPRRKELEEARRKAVAKLLPMLPELPPELLDPLGLEGRPYTLSDLQKLAFANSPLLKQAAARVDEARGAAIQAGLPPNPTMGYEGDTMGTTGGPGYQGGFVEQKVIVANKLQLQRAVAVMDLRNAELSLFRAQTDLATRVRGYYFAVLVAKESIRLNRALVKFTNELYNTQVRQVVRAGLAAPYEPMYLRALAVQAATNLVSARNQKIAAWKQLAASMGLPGLPQTQLAGRIDVPVPAFDHKEVLARVLAQHTDVRTAENAIQQSHYSLELARITPYPDVDIRLMIQKDRTGPPYEIAPSLAISIPIPVWDRNQGGIIQAQGVVVRQSEEPHRVRAELTRTLADAYNRYQTTREILDMYRDQILPDLVRAYRGVLLRYHTELAPGTVPPTAGPGGAASSPSFPSYGSAVPSLNDVVVAQQNLSGSITTYITTLGLMWQAVVDVADLLQTPDLFGVAGPTHPVAEIPDLEKLPPLPCCHPCSPIPEAHQRVLDGEWPNVAPGKMPVEPIDVLPPPTPLPGKDDKPAERETTSKQGE